MKRFIALCFSVILALSLSSAPAPAQTLPAPILTVATGGSVTFTWKPNLTRTDGTAVTGTLTYNLYSVSSAGAYTLLQAGITGTSNVRSNLNSGQPCYALSEKEDVTGEGAKSPTICINVTSAPGAPTSFTVTVTVSTP